jgi:hypothetical protein
MYGVCVCMFVAYLITLGCLQMMGTSHRQGDRQVSVCVICRTRDGVPVLLKLFVRMSGWGGLVSLLTGCYR